MTQRQERQPEERQLEESEGLIVVVTKYRPPETHEAFLALVRPTHETRIVHTFHQAQLAIADGQKRGRHIRMLS